MPNPMEGHAWAWSRMHSFRNAVKGSNWMSDTDCPLRMRGYTELAFVNLDSKLRKKIDSAVKRGYALENRTQLPTMLKMIEDFCPIANVPIGYIGKTDLRLYLSEPTKAQDMCDELNALSTLTESFKGNKMRLLSSWNKHGYHCVMANTMRKGATGQAAHLRSAFKEMRPTIDEFMEEDAAIREQIARWCADDSTVIRVPFDSHMKRGKQP